LQGIDNNYKRTKQWGVLGSSGGNPDVVDSEFALFRLRESIIRRSSMFHYKPLGNDLLYMT
jgi:hypothetical protein